MSAISTPRCAGGNRRPGERLLAEQRVHLAARGVREPRGAGDRLADADLLEQVAEHGLQPAARAPGTVADQPQRAAPVVDRAQDDASGEQAGVDGAPAALVDD